jgi:hypothetical protein
MIAKVVTKYQLDTMSEIRENLRYWLSLPPGERVSSVEILRRQRHGISGRLQRVARVTELTRS